jgi:HlyD family secretion protein
MRVKLRMLFLVCASGLLFTGCEKKSVNATRPVKSQIESSFREPARTRLENTYLITMPVFGRVDRIKWTVGDVVKKGEPLFSFDRLPLLKSVEEQKARLEELKAGNRKEDIAAGLATVDAAKSRLAELKAGARVEEKESARASVELERAQVKFRGRELSRMEKLFKERTMSDSKYEEAQFALSSAKARLKDVEAQYKLLKAGARAETIQTAQAQVRQVEQKLGLLRSGTRIEVISQAAARLAKAQHELSLTELNSPIDGIILERYEQGSRSLNAGHKLLLLGNLGELELAADVLTQDALLLKKGSLVRLELSGSAQEYLGQVRRVEPAGFTKISALGVEQQRVKVIVALEGKRPAGLGVGFRLHARFITASKAEALVVPRFSVLQSTDGQYYVFKIVSGLLKRQLVKIGLRSDLMLEITEGLTENDTIAATPDANYKDGTAVQVEAR